MGAFVVRRLFLSLITLALVSVLIFSATEILPGDVATSLLGQNATPQAVAALRTKLHLQQSPVDRYAHWVGNALRGDLGRSLARDEPVVAVLAYRLRNTLLLAALASLMAVPLALALGVIAALKHDRLPDLAISVTALVGGSIPEFVVGSLLILAFALHWPIFPSVTTISPDAPIGDLVPNMWLPAATLTVVMVAYIVRMIRTTLIDVMSSDYVQMAILEGLPRRRVVLRHAVPNALLPTVNAVALTVAWLVGGVVIVEAVFNYPGMGGLTVDAVRARDVPLVQALGLLGAASYIVINLAADLLMLALNPRLRTRER